MYKTFEDFLDSFISLWSLLFGDVEDVVYTFLTTPIELLPLKREYKNTANRLSLLTVNDVLCYLPDCPTNNIFFKGELLEFLCYLIRTYDTSKATLCLEQELSDRRSARIRDFIIKVCEDYYKKQKSIETIS